MCAKYTKEANSFKTVMYLFKLPILGIYQEILDTKKALFCIIKGLLQKSQVIGLGECTNLFVLFSSFSRYTRSLKQKYYIFKNCHKICAKPS